MAGIGFRLHRTVANGGYMQAASAYFSAVVISAGPWLSATLSLGVLGSASALFLNTTDRAMLFATITYAFFVSLILTSGLQMIVTRYLADHLYLKQVDSFAAICAGVLCCTVPLFVVASPFLFLASFDWRFKLLSVALLVIVSLIWLVMAFLSATREYMRIVANFVLGYALSLVAALQLGRAYGLLGSLAGFTGGQAVCLALLISYVYRAFPANPRISLSYVAFARKYWDLFLIGMLYAIALWVDNLTYWFSPNAKVIAGFFRMFPPYDTAKLVAYLLTIPAAAIFLIHVETRIYLRFNRFLLCIENKRPFREVSQAKENLASAIWTGVTAVVKFQGIVALGAMLFASDIATLCGLPVTWVPLLRLIVLAASVQYVMLVELLLLLYLDHRKAALTVISVYIGVDAILSLGTLLIGREAYYGVGYLVAAVIGAVLALWYLHRRLQQLTYVVFMLQPFGK